MSLEDIRISRPTELLRDAWRHCCLCEGVQKIEAEIKFDAGVAEISAGETLTGSLSGDTGVVDTVELLSGSWAGGDAAGYVTMSSPTGIDDDGHWGTDNESLLSSGPGSATLNGEGTKKVYGFTYPQRDLVFDEGKWYCQWHYPWRFRRLREDENVIDIHDGGIYDGV